MTHAIDSEWRYVTNLNHVEKWKGEGRWWTWRRWKC
jgi:hypothetical protein